MQTRTGKEPKAIKAIHKLVQPEGFNPCRTNDCENLCIVTSTSAEKDIGSKPTLGKIYLYWIFIFEFFGIGIKELVQIISLFLIFLFLLFICYMAVKLSNYFSVLIDFEDFGWRQNWIQF